MDTRFRCSEPNCLRQYYEDCDLCRECYCEVHIPFSKHSCATRLDTDNDRNLGDSASSQAFDSQISDLLSQSRYSQPQTYESLSYSSQSSIEQPQGTSSNLIHRSRSSSCSSKSAVVPVFKRPTAAPKRKRPSGMEPIETGPFRQKWKAGDIARCPKTTKVEDFKGTCWIWRYFKRLSQEELRGRKQNYEASCNICLEEAKADNRIKWTVLYDGSTTKLVRHLKACHEHLEKQHTNDIAVSLVSEGETKNMAEFLRTGNDDDTLYNYLKMCVMHLLPISLCSYKEFNGE